MEITILNLEGSADFVEHLVVHHTYEIDLIEVELLKIWIFFHPINRFEEVFDFSRFIFEHFFRLSLVLTYAT